MFHLTLALLNAGTRYLFYDYMVFLEIPLVKSQGFDKKVLFCFFLFEKHHPHLSHLAKGSFIRLLRDFDGSC
jgi:hypothetical protein